MEEKKSKVKEFLDNMTNLTEEEKAAELKKFSSVDRQNILAVEYIAQDIYPAKRFNRNLNKLALKIGGKVYFPIVGWTPDKIDRKWLSRCKVKKFRNEKEDRTYILYT